MSVRIDRADVFVEAMAFGRAGDRDNPRLLREKPRQCHLCGCRLLVIGDSAQQANQLQIGLAGFRREAGDVVAEVAGVEGRRRIDRSGEKAGAQRSPRHEADAELLAGGENAVLLDVACPERVFALHRGDRLNGMRAADRRRAGLGQAEVPNLAFSISCLHGPATSSIGTSGSTRC